MVMAMDMTAAMATAMITMIVKPAMKLTVNVKVPIKAIETATEAITVVMTINTSYISLNMSELYILGEAFKIIHPRRTSKGKETYQKKNEENINHVLSS